jgi:hypothetical protein
VSFADLSIGKKSWGTRIDVEDLTIALVNVTGPITEDHFIFV